MELLSKIKEKMKKKNGNFLTQGEYKELSWCFIATYILGLAAHGYCYLNGIFSHDSMMIFQNDTNIKLKSGRIFTPIYREWRSAFTAPWLIGVLSLMWLSLAVYFLTKLFEMQNKLNIMFVAGLFATNYSFTLLNATYIHDADFYMASVFFAVIGAYLCEKYTYGFLPAGVCFVLSMGFYQANFPIAVIILMLCFIRKALENDNWKKMLIKVGQMIGSALIAFLLYRLCVWMFVEKKGIRIDEEYNSITKAFDFAETDIHKLIHTTVDYVYDFFMVQNAYNLPRVRFATISLVIMALVAVCVVLINKKITILNKIIVVLVVAMIPLALNSIYFISNGLGGSFHHLMIYPFCMLYFVCLFMINNLKCYIKSKFKKSKNESYINSACRWLPRFVTLMLAIIIFNNITFANDIYLKKSLESQATLSLMTRVVDRMEQTEGYVPGQTEVVLVGDLYQSPLSRSRKGLDRFNYFTGQMVPFSVTYYETFERYFHYILGYPVNMVDVGIRNQYAGWEEVKTLPAFPAAGCTMMLDEKLIIKMGK